MKLKVAGSDVMSKIQSKCRYDTVMILIHGTLPIYRQLLALKIKTCQVDKSQENNFPVLAPVPHQHKRCPVIRACVLSPIGDEFELCATQRVGLAQLFFCTRPIEGFDELRG